MKKVLVVIDMQKDFVDGALGTKEAMAIVDTVTEKIHTFDGEVVYTRDTHHADYLNTQEGRELPVLHCVKDTEGWQLDHKVEAVKKQGDRVFEKQSFGSVELAKYLSDENMTEGLQEIVLIGLCTDICVISNAMLLKAYMPDVPVAVDAKCCAGVTIESHRRALEAMKMCQIQIVNEDE